jgi:hypothetical protein
VRPAGEEVVKQYAERPEKIKRMEARLARKVQKLAKKEQEK